MVARIFLWLGIVVLAIFIITLLRTRYQPKAKRKQHVVEPAPVPPAWPQGAFVNALALVDILTAEGLEGFNRQISCHTLAQLPPLAILHEILADYGKSQIAKLHHQQDADCHHCHIRAVGDNTDPAVVMVQLRAIQEDYTERIQLLSADLRAAHRQLSERYVEEVHSLGELLS